MNKRKILFTDLDGTLLSNDKTISSVNREAIKKALDEGHYVTVATGRPVVSARRVVRDLGLTLPGCYVIAFNGAVLYDSAADRILLERKIPAECVQKIFELARKDGIHVQTYTEHEVITEKKTKELDFYCKNTGMPYKLVSDVMSALEEEPNKILLAELGDRDKLIRFQKKNIEWTKKEMMSFFSCDEYLEYCPKDTTKGSGIRYLSKLLDVPIENTFAVGDERNDISMLEAAGTGIAMNNANEMVKNAADYVTEHDNNHHAIAEVIEKFLL